MNLYDSLIAKGLSPADAASIASEHGEPTVNTDALSKSLDGLRDTFAKGGNGAEADYIADLEGQVLEAGEIVKAISDGADAMLAEHRAQNDALSKAILAIGEELQGLRADHNHLAKSLTANGEVIAKSMGVATAKLREPIVKSVTAETVRSPVEGGQPEGSRSDAINKALTIMQSPDADSQTVERMAKAVSLLEAHAPIAQVVADYGIN